VCDNCEEMAIATVRMGEYVQTMSTLAAAVVFPEVIASVIVIVIASWWN
jgi:hypothetical protein